MVQAGAKRLNSVLKVYLNTDLPHIVIVILQNVNVLLFFGIGFMFSAINQSLSCFYINFIMSGMMHIQYLLLLLGKSRSC